MIAATFRDILVGTNQGTINSVHVVGDITVGTPWRTTDYLAIGFATIFFVGAAYILYNAWRRATENSAIEKYKTPLVPVLSSAEHGNKY